MPNDKTETTRYALTMNQIYKVCSEWVKFTAADKADPFMTESFDDFIARKYKRYVVKNAKRK